MSLYDKYATGPCLAVQEGQLLTITFNNPENMNSMSGPLQDTFEEILNIVKADRSVTAILVRGEGRSFSAGGNLKDFNDENHSPNKRPASIRVEETMWEAQKILDIMMSVPQPMLCAVQGFAMGLGTTVALFCDVVVASDDAKIADSHVAMGLVAGDGGAVIFPLLMSMGSAKWYLLTGERMSGQEAARLGLILKSVPAEELQAEAKRMALVLASGAPVALRGTKSALNRIIRHRMDLVLEHGLLLEGATFTSDDHREAVDAFFEKRPPVWTGR